MTTKFSTRKLISNFILFENLKINNFFLLYNFYKRTVLRKECLRVRVAPAIFVDVAVHDGGGARRAPT
jgi:hypothetical protein